MSYGSAMIKISFFLFLIHLIDQSISVNDEEYISRVEIDKQLFHEINRYRDCYGKDSLVWDKETYKACMHHSRYMLLARHVHHIETKNVRGLKKIYSLSGRVKKFIGITKAASENVLGGNYAILTDSSALGDFVRKFYKKELIDCSPSERICYRVIYEWRSSPSHNENLLSDDIKLGAVSLYYTEPKIFSKAIFFSGKEIQEQKVYCTFNGIRF